MMGFLCMMLIVSCTSKENARIVYSRLTGDYEIDISTIDTKIDENGVGQCSKYVKTSKSDTAYSSYGLNFSKQLAYSLGTTEKYISELPVDSLRSKYLKINIENLSGGKLNYDSIIRRNLLKAFKLHAVQKRKEVQGYKLIVTDSSRLAKFTSECGESLIKYRDGKFHADAVRFSGIAKIIDEYVDQYFEFEYSKEECYALEFPVSKKIEKMNEAFAQYGLRLDSAEVEQVFYTIETTL